MLYNSLMTSPAKPAPKGLNRVHALSKDGNRYTDGTYCSIRFDYAPKADLDDALITLEKAYENAKAALCTKMGA